MDTTLLDLAYDLFGDVTFGTDFIIELVVLCIVLEFTSCIFDWSKF